MNEELEPSVDGGSAGDEPIDYSELIENDAFIGEFSFDVLKEYIQDQFNDYIAMDDRTNYVDIYYEQLKRSYAAIEQDEDEIHRDELREVLDNIDNDFNSFIAHLFDQRLSLSIMDIENEDTDKNEIETTVRLLYEYFIINARSNFLNAIYKDIRRKISSLSVNEDAYFDTINEMLLAYSPLVTAMGPMEFIYYNMDGNIVELFNTGRVTGNFLRKYSPKLYANEDLQMSIINNVTIAATLGRDLENA